MLFNGSNTDERSQAIYAEWLARHEGTDRVTGSRTADMRSALVDYFREQGQIMIATEAGAEGINLQFCSLVVNYDLPWNPQRIEQRIGRCHRYGQKHDVVVVNFLNRKNAADQRVFELLSEKFKLFEGVFGASDEVLGAIESGVDFEKRIAAIYQQCRRPEEIQTAFDALAAGAGFRDHETRSARPGSNCWRTSTTRCGRSCGSGTKSSRASLNRYEQRLMALTRFELGGRRDFHVRIVVRPAPRAGRRTSRRALRVAASVRRGALLPTEPSSRGSRRRQSQVAATGRRRRRGAARSTIRTTPARSPSLEPLRRHDGDAAARLPAVETLGQAEDHLLLSAVAADGDVVAADVSARLFTIAGAVARLSGQLPLERTSSATRLRSATCRRSRAIRKRQCSVRPRSARRVRSRPKPTSWMAGPTT